MSFLWTDERIAEMTRLWHEGLATRVIGERLGTTKNAVIGKVRRLGLTRDNGPKVGDRSVLRAAARKRAADIRAARAKANPPKPKKLKPVPQVVEAAQVIELRQESKASIFDARERMKVWTRRGRFECAFPVGQPERPAEQQCCGRKTDGGRYCSEHRRIMFVEPVYKKRGEVRPLKMRIGARR